MNAIRDGDVLIDEALLYFEQDWVHLAGDEGYRVEPQDAAVLELVCAGVNGFQHLCAELQRKIPGVDQETVERDLAGSFSDKRSLLQLKPPVPIGHPDVIVCDFNGGGPALRSRRLLARLRRRHDVLFLGLKARARGPRSRNLCWERSKRAGHHSNWFEFIQWCRGVIRRSSDATIVLCGHQDTILFGDLVPFVRAFVILETGWPSPTGLRDLRGTDGPGEDELQATRNLMYALRCTPLNDIHMFNRASCSDFAELEHRALRHAAFVAYSATDQERVLSQIGRGSDSQRLVFADESHWLAAQAPEKPRRILALIAGLEEGAQPLAPFLGFLSTIADAGRIYDHIAVLSADGWRLVQPDPQGGGRLLPWSGPTPAASEIVTAMAFPGLVRDVGVLSGVPNAGVPLLLVPSSRAHPLQEAAPEASILRGMSSRAMGELLLRLADRSGADARELRRVQRPWLQRFLLSSALEEWIDRARAQNAEPAGAAR